LSIIVAERSGTLEAMRRVLLHSHVRGVRILTCLHAVCTFSEVSPEP
jgi:hypothetical protein